MAIWMDPIAWDVQEYLCQPHSTIGEPPMAGGEMNSVANTGTTIPAIPIKTKYTQMIYERSQTR